MVPVLDVLDSPSGHDVPVGRARFTLRYGAVSTTVSYDDAYLARREHAYALGSMLPLGQRAIRLSGLPGSFRDSAPDRWGRDLIKRAHRDRHLAAGEPLRQLDDVDFLVGVFDGTREGALRFCEPGKGLLAQSAPVPPLVQLPELLTASRSVAKDEAGTSQVKELLDAGSGSLGGARPKASVCDGDRLLLAKLSHPGDQWDVMAWEEAAWAMAHAVGIATPAAQLVRIGRESALLLERFDREGSKLEGRRIGYLSAMSVLGAQDGEGRDYAELAEAVAGIADDVDGQLRALFARTALSVALSNTDDHLRNWGFLRTGGGWALSSLFDVNPCPYQDALRATSIVGQAGSREAEGLRDLAAYAGLGREEAANLVARVLSATGQWRSHAQRDRCSEREMRMFEPVFESKRHDLERAFGL